MVSLEVNSRALVHHRLKNKPSIKGGDFLAKKTQKVANKYLSTIQISIDGEVSQRNLTPVTLPPLLKKKMDMTTYSEPETSRSNQSDNSPSVSPANSRYSQSESQRIEINRIMGTILEARNKRNDSDIIQLSTYVRRLDRSNLSALEHRMEAHLNLGNLDFASQDLELVNVQSFKMDNTLFSAKLEIKKHNYREALKILNSIRHANREFPEILFLLAEVYRCLGQSLKAIKKYEEYAITNKSFNLFLFTGLTFMTA